MSDTATTSASVEAERMLKELAYHRYKEFAKPPDGGQQPAETPDMLRSDLIAVLCELIELRKWAQAATALMQVHGFKFPPIPQVKA